MGPYCKFCDRRCFVHITEQVPQHIRVAYLPYSIMATCPQGQEYEKRKIGYCYADTQQVEVRP